MGQITSYDDVILPLVISKLRDKEMFRGMVSIGNKRADSLEKTMFDLINDTLSNCIGHQLDIAGEVIGMTRGDRDDESYRTLIFLKILINISSGEPDILIQAIQQLYGASIVDYHPVYPAKVRIWENGEFGIFIVSDFVSMDGNYIGLMDGDSLVGRGVDESSESILGGLLPSGVDLLLAHSVINQEGEEMALLDGNDLIGVIYG
ncbi:MAG: hypothetical protein B6241_12390 [Spirochaetaceae bacterium 4572_59]|nr:MAG: hypothetical protein B6241_12390 [Spirochaetaceae bacterium 4572_59]